MLGIFMVYVKSAVSSGKLILRSSTSDVDLSGLSCMLQQYSYGVAQDKACPANAWLTVTWKAIKSMYTLV